MKIECKRNTIVVIVSAVLLVCGGAPPAEERKDVWEDFRPLLGKWAGEGTGFGTVSDVTHEWDVILGGKFLRLQSRSVSRGESGGEDHEDVGYLSRDSDRNVFVFRQFLSEGFVNTFDVVVESTKPLAVAFNYREAESAGGMKVRMKLDFKGGNEYEMVLDLAPPGKDYTACQRMNMNRE